MTVIADRDPWRNAEEEKWKKQRGHTGSIITRWKRPSGVAHAERSVCRRVERRAAPDVWLDDGLGYEEHSTGQRLIGGRVSIVLKRRQV